MVSGAISEKIKIGLSPVSKLQLKARENSIVVSDVTLMLAGVERGDPKAADQLLVVVYDELRRLAAYKMARESLSQTLQPTALVHEAWLRLVGNRNPTFNDRTHFFRAASEA